MARHSAASLNVVPVGALARQAPPDSLSDAETGIWWDVVNSKPPEWFAPDNTPLLVEYCRAVVMCDWLNGKIAEGLLEGKAEEKMMRLRDMESKRAVTLGTKMRLTQQSRYTPQASSTANKKAGQAQPWQKAS